MHSYTEIKLSWKDPGIAFRVTFTNKNFQQQHELQKKTLYSKVLRLVSQKTL